MSERIQTGATEAIQVYAVDRRGAALTGLTDLYVRARRNSDGWFLDWTNFPTSTIFSATPAQILSPVMAEVDATNAPGLYEVMGGLDTGAITNPVADDTLVFIPLQTPGTDARLPSPAELHIGQWVDAVMLDLYESPYGPAIWIDMYYGAAGTTPGVHGTKDNPVNNEADAYTLATNAALGLRAFYIRNGSITLVSGGSTAYQDWLFAGPTWSSRVNVGGKNVWGSTFHRLALDGTFDPVGNEAFDISAFGCIVGQCTNITGNLVCCAVHSTLALPTIVIAFGLGGGLVLADCYNWNRATSPARITLGGAAAVGTSVRVQGYRGKLLVQNMAQAATNFEGSFQGADVEIDTTCTAGNVKLEGGCKVTDNSGVGCSVDISGVTHELVQGVDVSINDNHDQLGGALNALRRKHFNRREIDFAGQKEDLYDDAGATVIGSQSLADADGSAVAKLPGAPARIGKFS